MRHLGRLGQNGYIWNTGQGVLEDPVIPAISGTTVIKVAVTLGIFVWIFRSLGNK